jgi:arsenite methyltransferase
MNWFWRAVCSPDCSDACQVNCPGCYAMADEWASQGRTTVVTGRRASDFRWRNARYLWACWSRSASARVVRRLNPVRLVRGGAGRAGSTAGEAAAATGCGCHTTAATPLLRADVGIMPSRSPERDPVRAEVRRHYDDQARAVDAGAGDACCSGALPTEVSCVPAYPSEDLAAVPADAIVASLGCGNPFARADLRPGEVVLDLGSGGGMDALVAARHVGPDGHVFGIDMSDEMLRLAQRNAAAAGTGNVAFLKGDMESIPLPRNSVDVIISNCVVNLVPDKVAALREAYRVLRPGGRLSISDIVTREPVPAALKGDLSAWAACVGGALSEEEYRHSLSAAGFVDIEIERDREYTRRDADLAGVTPILERAGVAGALALGFANTSVRARRPGIESATADRAGTEPVTADRVGIEPTTGPAEPRERVSAAPVHTSRR